MEKFCINTVYIQLLLILNIHKVFSSISQGLPEPTWLEKNNDVILDINTANKPPGDRSFTKLSDPFSITLKCISNEQLRQGIVILYIDVMLAL